MISENCKNVSVMDPDNGAPFASDSEALRLREELENVKNKLEDTYTTIRVLLDRKGAEMSLMKDDLISKIRNLILPDLQSLRNPNLERNLREKQAVLVDNILTNLQLIDNNINITPLKLADHAISKLTPKEFMVASLIRDGKSNKEIAQLLSVSKSTILTHRHHVRAKLGLKNSKRNTRTFLTLELFKGQTSV